MDTSVANELIDLGVPKPGSLADLTADGIAISSDYAEDNNLRLGDTIPISFPVGPAPATVQAIYEGSQLGTAGPLLISIESYDQHFLSQQRIDYLVLAKLAAGVTAAEGRAAIERGHRAVPDGRAAVTTRSTRNRRKQRSTPSSTWSTRCCSSPCSSR